MPDPARPGTLSRPEPPSRGGRDRPVPAHPVPVPGQSHLPGPWCGSGSDPAGTRPRSPSTPCLPRSVPCAPGPGRRGLVAAGTARGSEGTARALPGRSGSTKDAAGAAAVMEGERVGVGLCVRVHGDVQGCVRVHACVCTTTLPSSPCPSCPLALGAAAGDFFAVLLSRGRGSRPGFGCEGWGSCRSDGSPCCGLCWGACTGAGRAVPRSSVCARTLTREPS